MVHPTRELAERLERAFAWRTAEFVRVCGEPHSVAEPIAGGWAPFVEPGHPVNRASGMGVRGEVAPADLDRLESFYLSRGEPVRVELCPFAHASLISLLGARAYRLRSFTTMHALSLARWSPPPAIEGVAVERVADSTVDEFARTISLGFHEGSEPAPMYLRIPRVNARMPSVACFLARVDGRPAGAGSVSLTPRDEGGVACLFGAATLPWARRRGVQRALLTARLGLARDAGFDLAGVMAETGSASDRNMHRVGFGALYTRPALGLQ